MISDSQDVHFWNVVLVHVTVKKIFEEMSSYRTRLIRLREYSISHIDRISSEY